MPFPLTGGSATRRIPGSAYTIQLQGTLGSPILATRTATGTARAGWRFNGTLLNGGGTYDRRQGTWAYYSDWAVPTSPDPSASYDIRATRQSGSETSLTTGNLNTWENLATTREYSIDNAVDGTTKDMVIKVEIRDTATQTIRATGYYKIEAIDSGGTTTTTTTTSPPTTATTLPPSTL